MKEFPSLLDGIMRVVQEVRKLFLSYMACKLMTADKNLIAQDAVDDVMDVYNCVSEALEEKKKDS